MLRTGKAFRNGNSEAVRIPADLTYECSDAELEIERIGDELRIRPVRWPLTAVLEKFAKFGPDFMAEGRGDNERAATRERKRHQLDNMVAAHEVSIDVILVTNTERRFFQLPRFENRKLAGRTLIVKTQFDIHPANLLTHPAALAGASR